MLYSCHLKALLENKIQLKIKKMYAFKQISEKVHGILKEICEPQHKFHKGQKLQVRCSMPKNLTAIKTLICGPFCYLPAHGTEQVLRHFSFTKTLALKILCKPMGTLVKRGSLFWEKIKKLAIRASWKFHMLIFFIISRKYNKLWMYIIKDWKREKETVSSEASE